ncbi:MAG: hypothetical protein ACFFD4_10240 [Candidatus Odinarchaeota archaeon]
MYLQPNFSPTLETFFLLIPLLLILLPIYLMSPDLIYSASRIKEDYKNWLEKYLDGIFKKNQKLLTDKEMRYIRKGIQNEVIPSLQRSLREEYSRKFHDRKTEGPDAFLTYQETVFLFALFSIVINFINLLILIYIHYNSLSFASIYIDQIASINNILFFAIIFSFFLIVSLFSLFKSQKEIKNYLSVSLSGLFPGVKSLQQETTAIKLEAFKAFEWEQLDPRITHKETIQDIIKETVYDDLVNLIRDSLRAEAGRQLIWKKYSSILERLDLPEKKKERLERSFFSSGILRTAKLIINEQEYRALEKDMLNVRAKINAWDEMREEDKITGFLYLFRVVETIFRNVLQQLGAEITQVSFHTMTGLLWELELIDKREKEFLHYIRIQRNAMLHDTGQIRPVSRQTMENMQELVESILSRARERIRL